MATDAAIEICEAVKDSLNAGSWSHTFTAARAYNLTAELEDDDGVTHVDVAVREETGEVESRSAMTEEVGIDVVVRAKCDVSDTSILDAYMGLLKQILNSFIATRLATSTHGDAWCHAWERSPAYFQNHITQYRQFTGLLTLRFSIAIDL